MFTANLASREEIEDAFKMRGMLPLTPFYTFFTLDGSFEELPQMASREIVCLAPIQKIDRLECYGLPDPYPQLRDFVQRQVCIPAFSDITPTNTMQSRDIALIAERNGMRIVNVEGPDDYPPETFRLDPSGSLWAPDGYLGLALLLCRRELDMIIVPDNEEVTWKPGEVLCFMEKGPKAKDYRNRIYFLLVLLEVEPI